MSTCALPDTNGNTWYPPWYWWQYVVPLLITMRDPTHGASPDSSDSFPRAVWVCLDTNGNMLSTSLYQWQHVDVWFLPRGSFLILMATCDSYGNYWYPWQHELCAWFQNCIGNFMQFTAANARPMQQYSAIHALTAIYFEFFILNKFGQMQYWWDEFTKIIHCTDLSLQLLYIIENK